jgi:hypothetical protein
MTMDVSQLQASQSAQWAQPMTGASGRRGAPPQQKMSDLFSRIDTGNTGSITKVQFDQAFSSMNPPNAFKEAGVKAVWSALDPRDTGQVSRGDFVSTMKNLMVDLRQDQPSTSVGHVADPSQTALEGMNGVKSFFL